MPTVLSGFADPAQRKYKAVVWKWKCTHVRILNVNNFGSAICIRLVSLAFAGSIGMTLIILACALPQYQ